MKGIKLFLMLACLSIAVSGCGTRHSVADAREFYTLPLKSNEAVVCFIRESVIPFQISPTVKVNGVALRSLPNNAYFCSAVKAGPKWIEANWSSLVKDAQNEVAVKLAPGEIAYVALKQIRPQAESLGQAYPSVWYQLKPEHAKPLMRNLKKAPWPISS